METTINIRKLVSNWAQRDGKHIVLARLIENRIGVSTADQLVRGCYPNEPKGAHRTLIESLLADAGVLQIEESKAV